MQKWTNKCQICDLCVSCYSVQSSTYPQDILHSRRLRIITLVKGRNRLRGGFPPPCGSENGVPWHSCGQMLFEFVDRRLQFSDRLNNAFDDMKLFISLLDIIIFLSFSKLLSYKEKYVKSRLLRQQWHLELRRPHSGSIIMILRLQPNNPLLFLSIA